MVCKDILILLSNNIARGKNIMNEKIALKIIIKSGWYFFCEATLLEKAPRPPTNADKIDKINQASIMIQYSRVRV